MKRITLFISLLCMMVGTALAQNANANAPQTGKLYRLKTGNLYLTIPKETINATNGHGTVPMLQLDQNYDGQVWFLEAVPEKTNQYIIRSANGVDALSCTHAWNCNTSSQGSAISIEPANDPADTYILRDSKKDQNANYLKVEKAQDHAYSFPYCNGSSDNAAKWTFEEVNDFAWVTYKYQVNSKDCISFKKGEKMNSQVTVPEQPYVTFENKNVNINSEATQEVIVSCQEVLPFVASNSFSEAHWFFIYMNDNKANCLKYNTENHKVNYSAYNAKQQGEDLEARLWCFVGNLADGFKIYNKKAGENSTLNATATNPTMGTASGNNGTWKLKTCRTNTNDAKQCCFTNDGTQCFNMQNGELKYWPDNDGGSMCRFPEPKEIILPNLDDTYGPLTGKLFGGSPVGVVSKDQAQELQTFVTKYEEVQRTETVAVDQLTALLAAYSTANNKVAELASSANGVESGYYFIYGTGNGNNAGWRLTYEGDTCKAKSLTNGQKLGAEHVWYLEKVSDGFKMQSCNRQAYLCLEDASNNGGKGSVITSDKSNSHTFNITSDGFGRLAVKNGNGWIMRTENGGDVNYWSGEDKERWYIIKATDLDLTIGDANYSTVYLPFDVSLPKEGNVKAYSVKQSTQAGKVSLVEKTEIPASQGAVLEGTGTHKLTILPKSEAATLAATNDWSENLLKGTNIDTYVEQDAYVLSKQNSGVGFYKAAKNKNGQGQAGSTHFKNNGNKAYLLLPQSAAAAKFYGFDFSEDGTTGIENIQDAFQSNNGNALIYDLSGRRVHSTAKGGIYIVNGKKVVR